MISAQPPSRLRVLIVAVQHPLDPAWRVRSGALTAARRLAYLLGRAEEGSDAHEIMVLTDDAPDEARRSTLASVLHQLRWLSEAPAGLLVLSGHFQEGRFLPRDARSGLEARTGLGLSEINDSLPPRCGVIVDGGVDAEDLSKASWVLAAGGSGMHPPPLSERGPTRFMHRLQQGLGGQAAPGRPVTALELARYVVDHAPAAASGFPGEAPWCQGDWDRWPEPLCTPGAPEICPRCQTSVSDAAAAFCHSCGSPLQAPETLDRGRYRLLHPLGAGGMGQVFVAEDTRLGLRRALKLLSVPEELPPEAAQSMGDRMIQEARAAQALGEHTHHVVRVFDVGHSPERGQPFLVMELLEGHTLTDRLARQPMTVGESLKLGVVIAETLAVAHGQSLVHRDLKPDNIMLVRRGEDAGFVKLLDFGLVKMDGGLVKTRTGRMMGTLQYMPPEQLMGQHVDPRADVFSLGAVLFECLSGCRANPGQTQGEIFNVLLKIGVRPLRSVAPSIPAAIADLIDRCLALKPDERPDDARAVADALKQIQSTLSADALAITLAPTPPPPAPPSEGITTSSLANGQISTPSGDRVAAGLSGGGARWALIAAALLLAAGLTYVFWPGHTPTGDPDAGAVAGSILSPDAGSGPGDARAPDARAPDAHTSDARPVDLGVVDAAPPPPDALVELRGLGVLVDVEEGPWFRSIRCGGGRPRDRLLTAEWSIPGHTRGQCKAGDCVKALVQALKTSRRNGETLRLELRVSRAEAPSEVGGDSRGDATHTFTCRVPGHALSVPR